MPRARGARRETRRWRAPRLEPLVSRRVPARASEFTVELRDAEAALRKNWIALSRRQPQPFSQQMPAWYAAAGWPCLAAGMKSG